MKTSPVKTLITAIPVMLVLSVAAIYGEPTSLEKGLDFYRDNKLDEALPYLEEAANQGNNADAYAWYAETLRRLKNPAAAVSVARSAVELESCHSFALSVMGDAFNPQLSGWDGADADSSWHYLLKAVDCDSSEGNAWMGIWTEAMRRGDRARETEALSRLLGMDFFPRMLVSYNRWMLRDLPEDAILITNGDHDTYPALALQEVEDFRSDVAVVNISLLNTKWYPRLMRDRHNIPLAYTDDELDELKPHRTTEGDVVFVSEKHLSHWIELAESDELGRPLTFAVTVYNTYLDLAEDHLRLSGPFFVYSPERVTAEEDTTALRISLENLDPFDFSGPAVSPREKSSVRMGGGLRLFKNVYAVAAKYAIALLASDRTAEAYEIARWVERFEAESRGEVIHQEEIRQLKAAIEAAGM